MTGWLKPDGKLIVCDLYQHLKVAEQFAGDVPKIYSWLSQVKSAEECCNAMIERGEHPEWHTHEIISDRASLAIRKLLLDNGYIRVGRSGNFIYFEGRPEALKSQHQRCRDLADEHGVTAAFEPQRDL